MIIASYLIDFYVINERKTKRRWRSCWVNKRAIRERGKAVKVHQVRYSIECHQKQLQLNWKGKWLNVRMVGVHDIFQKSLLPSMKFSNFFMCSLKFLPSKARAIHFTVQCNKWPHKKASSNVKLIPRIFPSLILLHVRFFSSTSWN